MIVITTTQPKSPSIMLEALKIYNILPFGLPKTIPIQKQIYPNYIHYIE